MRLPRRHLLAGSAAALAFGGLARNVQAQAATEETYLNEVPGYGPLVRDPERLLDLPEGFTYQVISQTGDTMADGLYVPGQPDGMACFDLGDGQVALVINHELKGSSGLHRNLGPGGFHQERIGLLDPSKAYDTYKDGRALPGGTTTLVYDLATRRTVRQHLSLAGTSTNCCGGRTPWGSWLSCEETEQTPANADVARPHGFVFEVPATAAGLVDPVPLKAMGRFDHEAVCVDPRTGVVYLTEDKTDGLFYRFLPTTPGRLVDGGRLQAMAFRGRPGADSSNQDGREWSVGDWREVVWIDLEDVESPNADLRMRGHADGAALVARGEGVVWGEGELYLTATAGGPLKRGQILRYVPSADEGRPGEAVRPGRIQLFLESEDIRSLNMGDNLTVAPWGHLIVCEDNYSTETRNHLKGVTPEGRTYTIGRNAFTGNSEFAGACFSPDGQVLFVNIMYPGVTFAIRGPWTSVRT
ncbi:alkaline phosphatase PhoX [Brevundimonas sp.]|uniref:alkaline phosphatase PhoX n=1 Tax=Brevundimonas sp. TaxID=1871086 RepID=UPI002D68070B|nr:alkaline phosphatase PhoX [Brevundimonas sp.]HYC68943.1 alkaline phosphatase PhoX [Brevundimonas sp.]